jgi:hypothetical protein
MELGCIKGYIIKDSERVGILEMKKIPHIRKNI